MMRSQPHGDPPVGVFQQPHRRPYEMRAQAAWWDLQGPASPLHGIVGAHDPLFLNAQSPPPHASLIRHEAAARRLGLAREAGVVIGDVDLPQSLVRSLYRDDAGKPELLR